MRKPVALWLCLVLTGSQLLTACASPPAASPRSPATPSPSVTVAPSTSTAKPPTAAPTPTPQASPTPVDLNGPITLTILYDNYAFDARLATDWGFAALIETGEANLLFDTGADGLTLMNNLGILGIDPGRIDSVILSHNHTDHTGGLNAILATNDHLTLYAPQSFPTSFKAHVSQLVHLVEVSGPIEVADRVRTTGELGAAIVEQALVVETSRGSIVITGCAHPGLIEIVRQAKSSGDVYLVVGGFHLLDKNADQIETVIHELKQLGVQKIAPSHCTGDQAISMFRAAFGQDYIRSGVGAVIVVGP